MPLPTKTDILMLVYEHKLEEMYTDPNKHTLPQTCTLLAASVLSCPFITAPTGAVKILHVQRSVLCLSVTLNGLALKIPITL